MLYKKHVKQRSLAALLCLALLSCVQSIEARGAAVIKVDFPQAQDFRIQQIPSETTSILLLVFQPQDLENGAPQNWALLTPAAPERHMMLEIGQKQFIALARDAEGVTLAAAKNLTEVQAGKTVQLELELLAELETVFEPAEIQRLNAIQEIVEAEIQNQPNRSTGVNAFPEPQPLQAQISNRPCEGLTVQQAKAELPEFRLMVIPEEARYLILAVYRDHPLQIEPSFKFLINLADPRVRLDQVNPGSKRVIVAAVDSFGRIIAANASAIVLQPGNTLKLDTEMFENYRTRLSAEELARLENLRAELLGGQSAPCPEQNQDAKSGEPERFLPEAEPEAEAPDVESPSASESLENDPSEDTPQEDPPPEEPPVEASVPSDPEPAPSRTSSGGASGPFPRGPEPTPSAIIINVGPSPGGSFNTDIEINSGAEGLPPIQLASPSPSPSP